MLKFLEDLALKFQIEANIGIGKWRNNLKIIYKAIRVLESLTLQLS